MWTIKKALYRTYHFLGKQIAPKLKYDDPELIEGEGALGRLTIKIKEDN